MKLNKLVELARLQNREFDSKMNYYETRKVHKKVDLQWLMTCLEDILGREFVEECAQAEIERMEREEDGPTDEIQA